MYRPQFSFPPAQEGTYDEDFVYSFDPYNTPALDIRFGPNDRILRLSLQMQSDAAFVHRSLKMNPSFTSYLGARLFFPDDSPLSDDLLPLSAFSANTGNPAAIIEGGDEGQGMIVPAGANYLVDIVNRSATQSAMPLVLSPALTLVDPINNGHGPVSAVVVPSAGGFGPWAYNGALYMVLGTDRTDITFQLEVLQSLDGGKTWQIVGASENPPGNATPVFDGDHQIIVAFSTSDVDVDGDLELINFDLNTLTWGPVYGDTSPPTTQLVYQVFLREDGTIAVLNNTHPSGAGAGSGLELSVFDGTSWTSIDAGAGILALPGYDNTQDFVDWCAAVIDDAGRMHLFFSTTGQAGPPNWNGRVFYQQIHADDTLGTFFDFPGNAGAPPFTIQSVLNSNPIIVGDSILLGVTLLNPAGLGSFGFYSSLIVGTGLATPTFAYMPTPGIDPTIFGSIFPGTEGQTAPYLLFDGRSIFAIYPAGISNLQLRVCYTNTPLTPLSGWTSVQVFDANDVGLPFNIPSFQQTLRPALNLIGNQIFITTDAQAPAAGHVFGINSRYLLGTMIVEPVRIQMRGVKRYVRTNRKQSCPK